MLIMAGNSLGDACMLCSKGGNMCSCSSNHGRMTEDDERRRRIAQAEFRSLFRTTESRCSGVTGLETCVVHCCIFLYKYT